MFAIRVFALLPRELRHHLRWYRISVRMEGAGLFENFVNFVRIGSWPFSKFWQNLSGLLPSLPYHWPGSSQRSETAHRSLALGAVRTCPKVACCHWSPTCCPKAEFRTNGHRSHPCPNWLKWYSICFEILILRPCSNVKCISGNSNTIGHLITYK